MTGTFVTPVLVARHLDPGTGRIDLTLPDGLTVAEIVARALPGATAEDLKRVRVALVNAAGASVVAPALWHLVRPRAGVRVVLRLIPGKGALRAVLTVVVAIAAVAMAAMFGGPLAAGIGLGASPAAVGFGKALVGLAVNVVGGLLINALVPPVKPSEEKRRNDYTISGWRNGFTPDGAIPVVLGSLRYAPPFGAMSWSEIEGDRQFIRTLFMFGEGRVDLTDFRIGDTSISEYDDIEMEVRSGVAGEAPCGLYPRQILEEGIGVELTRPLPRDDAGNVIDGEATETPVVRT
ncbi:MAG: phage tail protein, partial [Paracoccus sp. (in: a-proteobacteria)]